MLNMGISLCAWKADSFHYGYPPPPTYLLLLKQSQPESNFMEICSKHRGFLKAKPKPPEAR